MALTEMAEAAVTNGDHDRAARLTTEAEALTTQITHPEQRAMALAQVAEAAASNGDHHRAEALTAQITDPEWRAMALTEMAMAAVTNGDHDRAARLSTETEALTTQITDPNSRTEVQAQLAMTLMETIENTSPRGHSHHSSVVVVRARRLLAGVLATSSWMGVVSELGTR